MYGVRYLEGNQISRLEGLEHCVRLQELHLSNQKLPPTARFAFADDTLRTLAVRKLVLASKMRRRTSQLTCSAGSCRCGC